LNDPCDNYYVMSTTRQVVSEADVELGHFSDPPLLVLASLADGPKHGHAMTKNIEMMAGTKLSPGALYGAITRLEKKGLIEPLPAEERRHPYKITANGVAFLRAKLDTISRFANAGLKKLEAQ
jgi:DNA-binding PadR family transcriptional regulator